MKTRLFYIDILKTIGLLAVILAHVAPPLWLKQFRSFDVSLLVIVSGFLASKGNFTEASLSLKQVLDYIKKRFQRIVVPAWIFILFFLPVQTIFYHVPSIKELLLTFTFQHDCGLLGYLWIVWVFFVCACMVPFISRMRTNNITILTWVFVLFIAEILIMKTPLEEHRLLYCTLFTIIPYGFLTYLGYNIEKINKNYTIALSGLSFIALAIFLYYQDGIFVQTSIYKYPARLYYLSYGISVSLFLFSVMKSIKCRTLPIISFISGHTLWIYFWHILVLYTIQYVYPNGQWWLFFIVVVFVSLTITYVQDLIVNKYIKVIPVLKYFRG